VSHLPCYILNGLLALLLVIQQLQHNRITTALHDRILESKGLEPVPKVEAINKMVDALLPERKPYNQPKVTKAVQRIHFPIPGMPAMPEKK
jgi:hypothetical protein